MNATLYRWADVPLEEVTDLLHRRLVTGQRIMLAEVQLKKGCLVPRHAHEHEQITHVLQGSLRISVGDPTEKEYTVSAGQVLHLPSDVPHEALALEDTTVVDVFSPPRQDWIDGTDTYLRR